MKINKLLTNTTKNIVTIILLIIACLSMNNFYKITIGFVANEFEGGLFHLTIMIAYFLNYICFAVYFCNYYVKKLNKVATCIYSTIVTALSVFVLIGVFSNIDIYVRNHALGAYGAMPSLLGGFPYDAIITCVVLLAIQAYNISLVIKPNHKYAFLKESWYSLNTFKLSVFEYLPLCIISLLIFFFAGDAASGLLMIENVVYDPKYIFILLWLLLGTMGNLLSYVFKVENKINEKKNKVLYLLANVLVNVILVVLYIVFDKTSPDYIPQIAKPLFPITFSKSIPIEMMFVFGLQALAILAVLVKLVIVLLKKNNKQEA